MAQAPDHVYFPPLEECLKGGREVISWKLLATALADPSGSRQTTKAISTFLQDHRVQGFLGNPHQPFAAPDDSTRAEFETRTSAIHATPNSGGKYDINTVKEDAKWLSEKAGINLVAALRIVVVESQCRAAAHLAGPLSLQDSINLQETRGDDDTSLVAAMGGAGSTDADVLWEEFQRQEDRRLRIFKTYLSEKRFFMMCASYLYSVIFYGKLPITTTIPLDNLVEAYRLPNPSSKRDDIEARRTFAEEKASVYFNALERLLDSPDFHASDPLLDNDDVILDWHRTIFDQAVHITLVIFQAVDFVKDTTLSPELVGRWFSIMHNYCFFDSFQLSDPILRELQAAVQTVCCAISLRLLSPGKTLAHLARVPEGAGEDLLYVSDSSVMSTIHGAVCLAADQDALAVSPIMLAWSIILLKFHMSLNERSEKRDAVLQQQSAELLHKQDQEPRSETARRSSVGSIISIEELPQDVFLRSVGLDKDMQLIEQIAQQATVKGTAHVVLNEMALKAGVTSEAVFSPLHGSRIRGVFVDLLKWTYAVISYQDDSIVSFLNVVSGGATYWDISPDTGLSPETDVLATTLEDDALMEGYLEESMNRSPYELLPFLASTTALSRCTTLRGTDNSELVLQLLRETPTITVNLPDHFQDYELMFEGDNTNAFRLIAPLPLFVPRLRGRMHAAIEDFVIPEGTHGRFVTDSGRIVYVEYSHSALALMGSRLQISTTQSDYDLVLGPLNTDAIADIIGLLASLIRAETVKASFTAPSNRHQTATEIIEEASRSIDNNKDIIAVICDILDVSMQDEATLNEGRDLGILTACLQFLHAVIPIFPSRVLAYMARCGLLNSESRAGQLAKLTGRLDMTPHQFSFLISSVQLLSTVVDTIMNSSVQRKGGDKSSRSKVQDDSWLGNSDRTLSRLGYAIAQAAVDILENSSTWKFDSEISPTLLVKNVVPVMRNLVLFAYGVDTEGGSSRPTACLEAGAEYIIDSFLSTSTGSLRFQPLLKTIFGGSQTPQTTLYHTRAVAVQGQVVAVLDLATTLLQVRSIHDRPVGLLETHLFKSSGLLARLCAVNDQFKGPTLHLFNALVESAGRGFDEPPSLLGYLGPQVAKSFIDVLAKLDRPFSTPGEVSTIWKFFSSIIRNKQQWMSNCLITGKTPREVADTTKPKDLGSDSVFSTALEKLKNTDGLPRTEALAILDFVTSAQNYWPWTVFTLLKDPGCLDCLRSRVRKMPSSANTARSDPLAAAYDAKEASYIAEAFAMQLYHLRHMGGAKTAAENLLQDLDYYLRDGALVSGYNASLHANFRRNFANKYPSCSVESFKRTTLSPGELGDNYFYDLELADEMLRFAPGWRGPKGNGFKTEMERANLNLSLVDAQISLYHAWESLLLELNRCLPNNEVVSRFMQQVAQQCLEANREVQGPENIFVRIIKSRASFALSLIQGLIGVTMVPQDVNQLLVSLYGSITAIEAPFGEQSAPLYRTLLKALYIVLKAHAGQSGNAKTPAGDALVPRIQVGLDILDRIVGKGFRTLVTLVHDKDKTASPEDLSLITAVLQACLGIQEMDQQQTQVLNIMASHDTMHVACSLFSWSDRITDNGDPIYGELSLLFLLELSKLPMVAEQLACNGVISQLTSANLTRFMRRSVVSPFVDSAGAQRCYVIWAKAMLPLLLNLLTAMGATVAPEVAYVLNQFPSLLKSSVERFEAPGTNRTATSKEVMHSVSLLTVMEVHSLALLTRILEALRAGNSRDIPEVQWDAATLAEYVDFWLSSRRLLRERLLPLGQREVEWKGMRAATAGQDGGCENVLEEKVVVQLEAVRDILAEDEE